MNGRSWSHILLSAFSLALAPIAIAFGRTGMPTYGEMRDQHTADIVGVWAMSWGIVIVAAVAAVVVAWLAWNAEDATRQLDDWNSPESGSEPGSAKRFVA